MTKKQSEFGQMVCQMYPTIIGTPIFSDELGLVKYRIRVFVIQHAGYSNLLQKENWNIITER